LDNKHRRELGERLALVRASAGLSQKEMGDKLAISWRSYQNYELGSREPPADVLLRVCEAFGYRLPWIVLNEGGPKILSERTALRDLILKIGEALEKSELNLTRSARADIMARLITRQSDGFEVTTQEITDYIEIAGGQYD